MGRRPGISSTERAFRAAFANALKSVIGDQRGSASRAAEELRTSRQAISLYLKEKATPSAELVSRAIKAWNLKINIDGYILSETSYSQKVAVPVPANPLQLPLLTEALDAISDDDIDVKVAQRIGESIHLKVSLDFAKKRKRS